MKIGFIYTDSKMLNQAQQIMALCTEKGALDELGIGRIRDVFSNTLFPGISGLQSRAKYFVVLPLLYEDLAKMKWKDANEIRNVLRSHDKKLATQLCKAPDEFGGIIGASFVESNKMVKYDATYIYWSGMNTFEIVDNPNNVQINKLIYDASKKRRDTDIVDDETTESMKQARYWHIPDTYNWKEECDITLTYDEALFLKRQICQSMEVRNGNTLLAPLLESDLTAEDIDRCEFFSLPIEKLKLSPETYAIYSLANDFAEFIYGLYLRYNVLLAQVVDVNTKNVSTLDENIGKEFHDWMDTVWYGEQLNHRVSAIWSWLDSAKMTDRSGVEFCKLAAGYLSANDDYVKLDKLIIRREKDIKQSRRKIHNPDYYPFKPGQYIHYYRLDYRWSTARRIIADIKIGELGHE